MVLYFQSVKKRLKIDTNSKTFNIGFYTLGGWKTYIKVSPTDMRELIAQCINEGYTEESNGT